MSYRPRREPFTATLPPVGPGDSVEIRTADGVWYRSVARSGPRYDEPSALGGICFMSVAVDYPDGAVVNWPAVDVRVTP